MFNDENVGTDSSGWKHVVVFGGATLSVRIVADSDVRAVVRAQSLLKRLEPEIVVELLTEGELKVYSA